MAHKPASVSPSDEERRAAKIAAWAERRRRQGKPTDGSALGATLTGAGTPAGPAGGYIVNNQEV
jgi:hypothetical protein